jgi:hypothetical protein
VCAVCITSRLTCSMRSFEHQVSCKNLLVATEYFGVPLRDGALYRWQLLDMAAHAVSVSSARRCTLAILLSWPSTIPVSSALLGPPRCDLRQHDVVVISEL